MAAPSRAPIELLNSTKAAKSLAAMEGPAFCGLIDPVLTAPGEWSFEGSLTRSEAEIAWLWLRRDLAPDLLASVASAPDLIAVIPELIARVNKTVAGMGVDPDEDRRLRGRLAGLDVPGRLPVVLTVLRCARLLDKAQAFGRASGTISDEAELGKALQAMPLSDQPVSAVLLHAAVGAVEAPGHLLAGAVQLAGGSSEAAISRVGLAPLVEGVLAHAQDQLHLVRSGGGPFADADLACRAIDRFHRLSRALGVYVDLGLGSRWTKILGALASNLSELIAVRLEDVLPDLNGALRRAREGVDRVDSHRLLAALNGMYLLATVRECRDSLALNMRLDELWPETGKALETHLMRNLDQLRANPSDNVAATRLDTAIKIAEIRFNPDYAATLKRARANALHRFDAQN